MNLGNLKSVPVSERKDLVAGKTASAIENLTSKEVFVAEIDPNLSDTANFCEHYKVEIGQAANCVILEATRGDRIWHAACVVLGNTKADVNGLARRTLDARRVSLAPMAKAVELTGMEYGAITPIGLPPDWPILIDKKVAESPQVIIGSGIRK